MKENLIFITNYFGNGGAATVMKILAENLTKYKKIQIISFNDDDKKYQVPKNCEYIVLKKTKGKIGKVKKILQLRNLIKKNGKSVIISFEYFINMQSILANLFLKNKLIISERNDPAFVGNEKKNLRNFLYRFANVLVCQTPDAKEYFPNYIKKKSVIIYNPISEKLPQRYEGEREKKIVSFCRIEKQKNLNLMIDAFEDVIRNYPDYKLYIYGEGNEKENIINYIKKKKMDNNVIMMPFVKDIHEKIVKSSMFISTSDYEGISNSMLEAMAIGLPTICTDCPCGGARMMIKNGENGILFNVGNRQQLVDAILRLIENPTLSTKLSINAVKIKEKLNVKKIVNSWEKIIEDTKGKGI